MKRRAGVVIDSAGIAYQVVKSGTIFSAALLEEWRLDDGKSRGHWQRWSSFSIPIDLYTLLRPRAEARVAAWRAGGKRKAGAK